MKLIKIVPVLVIAYLVAFTFIPNGVIEDDAIDAYLATNEISLCIDSSMGKQLASAVNSEYGSTASGTYRMPLEGDIPITSPMQMNRIDYASSNGHAAWDMGVPSGTPLYSAYSGKVTAVTPPSNDSMGASIAIENEDGLGMRYMHMREQTPKQVGDEVQMGELIGYTGATGQGTGAHLHWEVYVWDATKAKDFTNDDFLLPKNGRYYINLMSDAAEFEADNKPNIRVTYSSNYPSAPEKFILKYTDGDVFQFRPQLPHGGI